MPDPRPDRFTDDLIRPFLTITTIIVTAVQVQSYPLIDPALAVTLFVVVSAVSVGALFPWTRLPQWQQVVLLGVYAVLASILLPLARTTSIASAFAFLASAVAGGKLASRRAAVGVAGLGAVTAAAATWVVGQVAPTPGQWPWWIALTVGLPVYVGISRRAREDALVNARRAAESEAREAALLERGRIAREIHDVLGHSLSGIALQLDMADVLTDSDRQDEATLAIRRARALAVDSIAETRRAVHSLREDTLPLQETLRLMAIGDAVTFRIIGDPEPIAVEAAHTVVRTAQEALTNAAKYAPGAVRAMTLEFTGAKVSLTVVNGPSTSAREAGIAGGSGMGLVGMRERAALVDGTLSAGPNSGNCGWTVKLEVPR